MPHIVQEDGFCMQQKLLKEEQNQSGLGSRFFVAVISLHSFHKKIRSLHSSRGAEVLSTETTHTPSELAGFFPPLS